jgi:uncharacterized protein involved in exopolysaccharide biosynthesis
MVARLSAAPLNEYLAYHAHISHDPEAEKFFNEQAGLLQARLDASEDKLRKFEVQTGITDVRAQKQALVSRLSDLEVEAARANTGAASAHEQVACGSHLPVQRARAQNPRDHPIG